jgi:hypothetical protein
VLDPGPDVPEAPFVLLLPVAAAVLLAFRARKRVAR